MVFLEVAAGYTMLKSAIDGVKNAIETGKDAHGIAKLVGSIFTAQDQINKQKNHNVSVKDQLGMENIVSDEIDARLLQEQLDEIRSLCNMRFGSTFWADCISARNKAIADQKEKERKIKLRKAQDMKEIKDNLLVLSYIVCGALLIFGMFAVYMEAYAKDYTYQQKIRRGEIQVHKTTTCRLFFQEIKDNKSTRWCYYQTRLGFDRKYSTITQDSIQFCQREFKCRINALTDQPPKEIKDTMKNLNKGFK